MGQYTPFTRKGLEIQEQGFDPDTVRSIDEDEAKKENQQALAEFLRRHPEAARPETLTAIDRQIAEHAERYNRRRMYEPPIEILEDAFERAQMQQAPSAEDEQRPITGGHDPLARRDPFARYREGEDRRSAAQAMFKNSGDLVGAARLLGARGLEHFEHREEPGRGGR